MTADHPIITLITDYGLQDGYVGALKGAILHSCSTASLVDVTHLVPPQDVLAGAVATLVAARAFPQDTIHTVVVDPEVGSDRAGLLVRARDQWFVAPDSGVLHFLLEDPEAKVFRLKPKTTDVPATTTFDGRDWFGPAAAALAAGTSATDLADPTDEFALLQIPTPTFDDFRWVGRVLHADHFGNLISDLPAPPKDQLSSARVFVNDRSVGPIRAAYAEVPAQKPVATIGSLGTVEVGLNQGNAQRHFRIKRGATFEILFPQRVEPPIYPAWR